MVASSFRKAVLAVDMSSTRSLRIRYGFMSSVGDLRKERLTAAAVTSSYLKCLFSVVFGKGVFGKRSNRLCN